jgi:hypothetical protein
VHDPRHSIEAEEPATKIDPALQLARSIAAIKRIDEDVARLEEERTKHEHLIQDAAETLTQLMEEANQVVAGDHTYDEEQTTMGWPIKMSGD